MTLRTSLLLFLSCVVRASGMGHDDWRGDTDAHRLPPATLTNHLGESVRRNLTVAAYFERVLADFVVRQHVRNALRKLAGDPSKYSVLFTIENERVFPLKPHRAFTSDPRFRNASQMLRDLGLLAEDGTVLMPAGTQLLADIRAVSP